MRRMWYSPVSWVALSAQSLEVERSNTTYVAHTFLLYLTQVHKQSEYGINQLSQTPESGPTDAFMPVQPAAIFVEPTESGNPLAGCPESG